MLKLTAAFTLKNATGISVKLFVFTKVCSYTISRAIIKSPALKIAPSFRTYINNTRSPSIKICDKNDKFRAFFTP